MNKGFLLHSQSGEYHVDSIRLLASVRGNSASDVCRTETDLAELEQYFCHGLICYERDKEGKLVLHDVDRKYGTLYENVDTTWFCYVPQKIELDLTRKCNFNCIHCSRNSSPSVVDGGMPVEDLVRVIEEAGRIGVTSLSFLGGEPTCHPDFLKLAMIAKESGIHTLSTSTNGWLVNENLATRMAQLFSSVQVSLHGATADTHDRIVGRSGAFTRAFKAVSLLRSSNVASLNISFTVMKDNVDEMPSVVKIAKEFKVNYIRFLVLSPRGRGKLLSQWSREEIEEIGKNIKDLRNRYMSEMRVEAGGFPPYCDIRNDATFYGCPAGRTLMYISSDGVAGPCGALDVAVGTVKESRLLDLWHCDAMVKLRRKPSCGCPYSAICSGGCLANPYWANMFLEQ